MNQKDNDDRKIECNKKDVDHLRKLKYDLLSRFASRHKVCDSTEQRREKYNSKARIRAQLESQKTSAAKRIARERKRRLPVVTYPSDEDLGKSLGMPPVEVPNVGLGISPSLEALLDKHFGPCRKEDRDFSINLQMIQRLPIIVEPTRPSKATVAKTKRLLRMKPTSTLTDRQIIANAFKKRLHNLQKLKGFYLKDKVCQKVDADKAKQALEVQKNTYIESLSMKHNWDLDVLTNMSDKLFDEYRKSQQALEKTNEDLIQKDVEWMKRILSLQSFKRPPPPPKPQEVLSKSLLPLEDGSFLDDQKTIEKEVDNDEKEDGEEEVGEIAKMPQDEVSLTQGVKEIETPAKGDSERDENQSDEPSERRRKSSQRRESSKRRQSAKRRKSAKGRKSSKQGESAKRPSKPVFTVKKVGTRRISKGTEKMVSTEEEPPIIYRPCDATVPTSQLYPDLVKMYNEWDQTTQDALRYSQILKNRLPSHDSDYVVVPKKLFFNNYVVGKTYTLKLKIMYKGKTQGSFKPHEVSSVPVEASTLFKVDPRMIQVAPAGIARFVGVTFRPVDFTEKLEGNITFLTRNMNANWKMFQVRLICKYPAPQLRVSPKTVRFEPMKIWSRESQVKYISIRNTGTVASTVSITRVVNMVEEEEPGSGEIENNSVFSIYPRIKHKAMTYKTNPAEFQDDPIEDAEEEEEVVEEEEEEENEEASQQDESAVVSKDIVKSLMTDTFSSMKVNGVFNFDIQGRTRVTVPVVFKPSQAPFSGLNHDTWRLKFTADRGFERIEEVHLVGEVEAVPLTAQPKVVDFKICLVENGTQQNSFQVYNDSRSSQQLIVKIPKCMTDHASVDETNPFILGKGKINVVVRLKLTSNFCTDAAKYFDEKTHILDFPVFVKSKNEALTGPPVQIQIMAVVTRSMGLTMSPPLVNLGRVQTYHTVYASFYLNNHSLATHNFAFIGLPKNVMIQPNYGFGTIAPGERLKLDILYSPTTDDVPVGGIEDKFFIVACTTVDRLAFHESLHHELNPTANTIKIPHQLLPQKTTHEVTYYSEEEDEDDGGEKDKSTLSLVRPSSNREIHSRQSKKRSSSKPRARKETFRKTLEEEIEKLNFEVNMSNFEEILELYKRQSVAQNKKGSKDKKSLLQESPRDKPEDSENDLTAGSESPEIYPVCSIPDPLFTILAVKATVQDPVCELSSQKVYLTPTAIYSYSITPVYLKGRNYQSKPLFLCEKEESPKKRGKIKMKYEVFSESKYLEIEPCYGKLTYGQEVKLNLIVRPKLTEDEITQRAKEMKALRELLRLKNQWALKHKRASHSRRSSSRRSSKRGSVKRGSMKRGSVKRGSVKRKSMKRGSVKRKSMKRGSVKRGSVKRGSVKRGSMKRGSMKRKSMKGTEPKKRLTVAKGTPGERKDKLPSVEPDFKVDPESMSVNANDLFHAQLDLLKRREDTLFKTKFIVLVESQRGKDVSTKRIEQLECIVTGEFVKPDIVVFTPDSLDQHMKFETTAVSRTRTQYFQIHNTSYRDILVKTSFLNNQEEFCIPHKIPLDQHMPNHFLKTGFWLEPDHSVTLPVVFAPKTERTISEFLEVRANRTVIPVKLVGRGVKPKYRISPEFLVGKMISFKGRKAAVTIGIENKCEAELEFNFLKMYTKEGQIIPLDQRAVVKTPRKSAEEGGDAQSRKSMKRQSVKRQSVKRGSVKRKSLKRKSLKGGGGTRDSKAGDKPPHPIRQIQDEKAMIKFDPNHHDDIISDHTIDALKTQFVDVNEERKQYLFNSPGRVLVKPLSKVKLFVEFEPVRPKHDEKEAHKLPEAEDGKSKKSITSGTSRKSVAGERKSLKRQSVKKGSIKRKSMKRGSVKRGSVKRGSVKRGSVKRGSVKRGSVKRGSVKRGSVKRGSVKRGSIKRGSTKGGKARESLYLKVDPEMFKHTYASKIRLMLGHGEKVLDWWFLGQVHDKQS